MTARRFYNAAGELDGLPHARTFAEEAASALSAMDAVLRGAPAVYASSELTSGKRAFALMREQGVHDIAELRRRIGEDEYRRRIWDPNHSEAIAFAAALQRRLVGEVVVTPAPFVARGWSQAEYLALWESFIRTRVKLVYLGIDWEYSFGCAFEFAVAHDAGIATFGEDGVALDLTAGMTRIAHAVAEVEAARLDVRGLREVLTRLQAMTAAALPRR